MTTVSKPPASSASSSSSSRYVPIRPLFRPLLPKPDATKKATALASSSAVPSLACLKSATTGTTTTTTAGKSNIKIERRRSDGDKNTRPKKVTKAPCKPKKPRAQSQPATQAAVAAAATAVTTTTLPSTISPASLVCSNKKPVKGSKKAAVSNIGGNTKKATSKKNPASIDTLINNASPDNPAPIAGMSSINTASLLSSTAKNALRPSKLSSKLMLCSDVSTTTGLATPSFDLGSSDLYLLGSSAPTSPSSLVDSISLWDDETKQDLSIQLEIATSGELDASSPLAGSPIEPLTLQMDVDDEHAVDDDFSAYGESLTLDSYLTPESDDASQEFRDTLFLGTVSS